jgi:mRNA interferase HicA
MVSPQLSPPFVARASRFRCGGAHRAEGGAGVADHYVKPAGASTPRHSAQIGGRSRRVVRDAGYRSHGRLYYGDRFTTLKDRRKEIGKGLLKAMCTQLGIAPEER